MSIDSFGPVAAVAQISTAHPAQQTEVSVLKIRLTDLETRLRETTTHRAELREYVDKAGPVGNLAPTPRHQINMVDAQIKQLDVEILNLQSDIRLTKAQIEQAAPVGVPTPVAAPAPVATPALPAPAVISVPPVTSSPPPVALGPDLPLLGMMFLVLAPLAIAIAWRIARGGRDVVRRGEWLASESRIQRIEEAVEGIARDVDRMSEGQRFLTNVLSEGPAPTTAPIRERERVAR